MTSPSAIKTALERAFSTEEAFGVFFQNTSKDDDVLTAKAYDHLSAKALESDADRVSLLADHSSAACCTNYACFIGLVLGFDRVEVRGFANEENPGCLVVRLELHPGGHDFAVVDDRYLVDPWVKFLHGLDWQPVYDMLDPADAVLVDERYGDASAWQTMTRAMELAQAHQPRSPVQVARVTLLPAQAKEPIVWSGLCADEQIASHLAQRELTVLTGIAHTVKSIEMFSLSGLDIGVPAAPSSDSTAYAVS